MRELPSPRFSSFSGCPEGPAFRGAVWAAAVPGGGSEETTPHPQEEQRAAQELRTGLPGVNRGAPGQSLVRAAERKAP